MPYISDRVVHDADAHIYEAPGWIEPWLEADVRDDALALIRRGFYRHNFEDLMGSALEVLR